MPTKYYLVYIYNLLLYSNLNNFTSMNNLKIKFLANSISFLILLYHPPLLGQSVSSSGHHINNFAWLAGHWQGDGFGGQSVEIWSPPSAGTMMGMYQHSQQGKVIFYEFFIIKEEADGFKLKLKHFTSELIGWEEKDKYVTFPLLSLSPTRIEFDGLIMEKIDNDKIQVTVQIQQKNGEIKKEVFHYIRVENQSQ